MNRLTNGNPADIRFDLNEGGHPQIAKATYASSLGNYRFDTLIQGFLDPTAIAVGKQGNVYLSDNNEKRLSNSIVWVTKLAIVQNAL